MKRRFLSIMVFVMSGLMMVSTVEAQGRRGGNSQRSSQSVSRQRPSGNNHNGTTRPGGNSNHNKPTGPSVNKPTHDNKPGNKPGGQHGVRPGGNNNRPGGTGMRPTPLPAPKPGHGNFRPGSSHRPVAIKPPTRPGRPIYHRAWSRPLPPPNWRPAYRTNLVGSILGLTFGLTINNALDRLYSGGYAIDGYDSQQVFIRNVTEMGYLWDDATLYFSSGGLVRSQFYDSSAGFNMSRYNNLYARLVNTYGAPVTNNGSYATWFGYNGDYITLEYTQMSSSSGYRYFTILTIGN